MIFNTFGHSYVLHFFSRFFLHKNNKPKIKIDNEQCASKVNSISSNCVRLFAHFNNVKLFYIFCSLFMLFSTIFREMKTLMFFAIYFCLDVYGVCGGVRAPACASVCVLVLFPSALPRFHTIAEYTAAFISPNRKHVLSSLSEAREKRSESLSDRVNWRGMENSVERARIRATIPLRALQRGTQKKTDVERKRELIPRQAAKTVSKAHN